MEYVLVVVLIAVIVAKIRNEGKENTTNNELKLKYAYTKKRFIMTKAENEFYHALQSAVGTHYMIYPQAHLDLFLEHKVKGQSWRSALSSIQRKSVDFLICNRDYYSPLVAIELDDASHNTPERMERDAKVDAICQTASMPLVRVKWQSKYDSNELLAKLSPYLT